MAPKTIAQAIANALENLSRHDYEKFCHALLDRRAHPRVRRAQVEGKTYLEVTSRLVSTFTETGAMGVTVELLRQIELNQDADDLAQEAGRLTGEPESGDNEHFVDKHRTQLIQRVGNIAMILDELLDQRVIQQETYNKIRAMSTPQDKMRELYCTGLGAGKRCKDIFYEILKKNDPYLIDDLLSN